MGRLKRLILAVLFLSLLVCGASAAPEEFSRVFINGAHRSLSGQFIIRNAPEAPDNFRVKSLPDNMVRLDADLLAVSCERIKTAFLKQLDRRDAYRSKIFINLFHSHGENLDIMAAAMRDGPDWVYRLDMPDVIDRTRLVDGIVEVLMLEIANQDSDHSVELPVWLVRGMTRQIISYSPIQMVIDTPRLSASGLFLTRTESTNKLDQLGLTRQLLKDHPPLTLEELSWPVDAQFEGVSAQAYDASAQLLVHELLELKDGRAKLLNMLADLRNHYNWQLAFMTGFGEDFANQLAWEKWWALRVAHFTGRNLSETWSPEESWAKLDDLLHANVDVRSDANALPMHSQISLQAVIKNWDLMRQSREIQTKIAELNLMRLTISQNLVYFVQDYSQVLGDYLRKRNGRSLMPSSKTIYPAQYDRLARATVEKLDTLDAARYKLRPKPVGQRQMATAPEQIINGQ